MPVSDHSKLYIVVIRSGALLVPVANGVPGLALWCCVLTHR